MLGTYPYPELESVPSIVTAIVSAVPPIPEVISVNTIAEDELWKALRRCCSYDPESRPTMEETACYIADLFPRSVSTASDNVTEGMVTSEIVHSTKLLQEYPEKSSHTQKRRLSSAENQASTTQLDDKLLMESSLRPKQRRRIYEESQNEYDSETELSQLPHANAEFNSASRSLSPTCLTGTRIELLQTIEEWVNANDPSTPSIFWLPGLTGTGKSTVAQTVATALHAKHRLGASFFFSRAEVDRNDPLLVIPSITYQLAHFNPVFRQHISRCLRTEPDAPRSAVKTQIDKLIVGPLQHVKGTLPPVIVVVDALDECADEDMADEMVKLLAMAVEKIPFRLKFFITSRPNDHLRRVFDSPLLIPRTLIFTLHEITEEIIRRDIELFIRHGLQEIKEKMLEDEDWPSEEEVQGLVNKSGGLFLFASTSLKFIGDKYHRDPQGRLEIILSSSPGPGSSTTNSVYADIDNLYLQVLHNATPLDHYDKMCERFRNVVGTLILLRDPLPSEVLAALIGTRNATVQAAVALLRSIISVPSSKRPLHVLHQSFPEFLTQRARCSDDRFFINSLQHHGRLALLCLDHMNTFLSRDMCQIEDSSLLNSEVVELETRREATIFQHFQYACRHWAFHLCRASFTQDLQRSLKGFCETKLLNWIEALSLFGWMDLARSALEDAINWFQVSLLNDGLKRSVLTEFFKIV
ncbi:hypothetical protein FRC03_005767 [Tulasnella sp. 419]|nr:hypothetical protein FRC03_005767 [Tulasnella sp. 419]